MLLIWWGAAAIATLVWLAIRPRRQVPWRRLVILPALMGVAPIAVVLATSSLSALEPASAKFTRIFGIEPPASITKIQAREETGTDFGGMYLSFFANPADLSTVTTKLSGSAAKPQDGGPSWWGMANCPLVEAFDFESATTERWDTKVLFHCEATNQVLVRARWVD